jgi:hypothetical protein
MKRTTASGPVEYVNYKSVSIPIYRADTVKKGQVYPGFRFPYDNQGKPSFKRKPTLEAIRLVARKVAEEMLRGTFSTGSPSLLLTGAKLAEYEMLMEQEKEVGNLLAFLRSDAIPAHHILAGIPKGSLLSAANHYKQSVGALRPMSVKRAGVRYLARSRHRWSKSYFERAKRHVGYFIALFGHKQLRDVTITDLETFMNTYKRRIKAAGAARKALRVAQKTKSQ